MDATYWRAAVGSAPWADELHPLAAGAPAALQAAAQRAFDARTEPVTYQVPYMPATALGKTITLVSGQGALVRGRITALEHIFEGGQAVTRLELQQFF